jgi:hypothetical protein
MYKENIMEKKEISIDTSVSQPTIDFVVNNPEGFQTPEDANEVMQKALTVLVHAAHYLGGTLKVEYRAP